jgi:D-glycero-D-manno-heptose 1,7-bisphosphate phosphatase
MFLTFPLEPLYDRDVSTLKYFPKGVIVFDRDGTLVEDAGQHNDPTRLKLRPGVVEAISLLKALEFGVAVASNQSGLETGKFTLTNLTNFNDALKMKLNVGKSEGIDLILVCPHQESANCGCRKPKNGLLEAIRQSGLGDLKLFIGDAESDRLAAISSSLEFVNVNTEDVFEQLENWILANELS